MPLLGLLLLGAAALIGWKMCGSDIKDAGSAAIDGAKDVGGAVVDGAKDAGNAVADGAKAVGDVVADGANAVGDVVADGANAVKGAISSISLPGGAEIKAAAGSFTDKFTKFLGDKGGDLNTRFTFDGVNFATGSANLTSESKSQIQNLANIMKAYPSVNIRLEGHTDNTGNAASNKTLSNQRALSVKNALGQLGVAANRVAAVGYGQEKPVADNGTEAGKLENRRVDVYITKR